MKKFLDYTGLEYIIGKFKDLFVQKETGKGLSTNDFTNAQKTKLVGIEDNAQVNVLEKVSRNGTVLPITNKGVNISVPTKVSELTNDENYKTQSEILDLINTHGKMKYEVVTNLPSTGNDSTIYLVPSDTGHAEYIWVNNAFEKLGDTSQVDLTGYLKESDLVAITNAEIDSLMVA